MVGREEHGRFGDISLNMNANAYDTQAASKEQTGGFTTETKLSCCIAKGHNYEMADAHVYHEETDEC